MKLLKYTIPFLVTVLFNIFIRQTLTDDFWRLHKNKNCAFPLKVATNSMLFSNPMTSISIWFQKIQFSSNSWRIVLRQRPMVLLFILIYTFQKSPEQNFTFQTQNRRLQSKAALLSSRPACESLVTTFVQLDFRGLHLHNLKSLLTISLYTTFAQPNFYCIHTI